MQGRAASGGALAPQPPRATRVALRFFVPWHGKQQQAPTWIFPLYCGDKELEYT